MKPLPFTRHSKVPIQPLVMPNPLYAVEIRERQTSSDSFESRSKECQMSWLTAWGVRGALARTAVAAGIAGVAVMGATVSANATSAGAGLDGVPPLAPAFVQDDPACDWLGARHPLCGGGAFESPPDDGIPGDNAAIGGIPAPAMVPNINGTLSPPGTPGAI